ncbi:hypothetical protein NC653_015021 [Populus alba x Populus x berolinensis]|uniref:AT-hook motif nuclear-localized protein n=1 Tax=Populus alba x Populus x berolinensis TaxID=444605 RepID=A0AAD6QYJ7_9ROSI|nr:hypothetical protein NC653_015021 [Populus alba x Populus x berolinensis]
MPGSETGVMTSREPFSLTGLQQKTATSVLTALAVYKPISTVTTTSAVSPTYPPGGGEGPAGGAVVSPHGINVNMGGGIGGESMKRKRGRPRRLLQSAPQSVAVTQPTSTATGGGFSSPPAQTHPLVSPPPPPPGSDVGVVGAAGGSVSPTGVKKARGRPPGSSKKQQLDALAEIATSKSRRIILRIDEGILEDQLDLDSLHMVITVKAGEVYIVLIF